MRLRPGLLAALALCGVAVTAHGQSPVGGALGAPAQARVAAPAPAPSVKPGEGGGKPAEPAAATTLAQAMAAGDMYRAACLGASAADIVRWHQAQGRFAPVDPDLATIVVSPDNQMVRVTMPPGSVPPPPPIADPPPPGFRSFNGAVAVATPMPPGSITVRPMTASEPPQAPPVCAP